MKHKKAAVLLALLGFSAVLGLGIAQAGTTTEGASKDSYFSALDPNFDAGYSSNLTIGGPADIYSAFAFAAVNPAGTVVTDFELTFDIQETIPTNEPFTLNIWALGGSWDESSTRNSISSFSHIPLGSVSGKEGTLPNGDNSITFSGANLTSLYASGQVANGIFWQDNDLASLFPGGATAFSNNTPFGEVGTTTYVSVVPEPSTWVLMALAICALVFIRQRNRHQA